MIMMMYKPERHKSATMKDVTTQRAMQVNWSGLVLTLS